MTGEEAVFCEKSYLGETNCVDCKHYGTDACKSRESHKMAIKALEQTRWIPVSERVPEEREWMGTKQFGTTISDEVYVTLQTPDGERFTKHMFFENGGLSQADQEYVRVWLKGAVPIAWMPLPAPYDPQESEGKDG